MQVNNLLIKIVGWRALFLQSTPTVYDRWKFLQRHLLRGNKRTLDVGCGAGEFTIYAALAGNCVVGISFDEQLNQIGKIRASLLNAQNVEFVTGDIRALERLSDRLGMFDQVICFETLEHILNDQKLMNDIARLLKIGGQVLVTTPFKYARFSPHATLSTWEDGGHVRAGYTFEEMRVLFMSAGFDMLSQEFLSGFLSQQIANWIEIAERWRYAAWAFTLPLRFFLLMDSWITRLIRYPFLCIGVVGIKRS